MWTPLALPLPGGEGAGGGARRSRPFAESAPPHHEQARMSPDIRSHAGGMACLLIPLPAGERGWYRVAMTDPDSLAARVAHAMLSTEGTGPAWGVAIEETREGYARIRMSMRADMVNGHRTAHGGMVFAL